MCARKVAINYGILSFFIVFKPPKSPFGKGGLFKEFCLFIFSM